MVILWFSIMTVGAFSVPLRGDWHQVVWPMLVLNVNPFRIKGTKVSSAWDHVVETHKYNMGHSRQPPNLLNITARL